ncbi:MAG: C-GCAxxG-C-C family protein [Defluviitaleaceae bacterium]|nr:C-GCAxxG-C-C family protein [Defluviitaleaceae bacterium]
MTPDKILELENLAAEKCENYRKQGFHCSESSLRAVAEALDIPISEDFKRISSGFRGGGGGYMERCGIVEVGIMLISYLYGRTDPKVDEGSYSYLVRILHERFIKELGSYTCRQLLPWSRANTEERNCSIVYDKGARILTRLLSEADDLIANMTEEERKLLVIWDIKFQK